MKVLVVMGSPRKGNTYRAAERIRGLMEAHGPVEFEYLWLGDANLLPCRGCAVCVAKGEEHCPNRDDAQAIVQRMREADGDSRVDARRTFRPAPRSTASSIVIERPNDRGYVCYLTVTGPDSGNRDFYHRYRMVAGHPGTVLTG